MSIGKTVETQLKTESSTNSPAVTTKTTVIVPENSETQGTSVVNTNSASKMISSVYLALVPVAFLAYL